MKLNDVYIAARGVCYPVNMIFRNKKFNILTDKDLEAGAEPGIIVFTGGEDVNPMLYGEKPIPETSFSVQRDAADIDLWKKYPKAAKVGICRGGQFLNVMNGGKMWQHVSHHAGKGHRIHNLLKVGPLNKTMTIMVTSTHHQMMIAHPEGEVIAIAVREGNRKIGLSDTYKNDKGEQPLQKFDTEVVWYEKTKSLCYQPHPEYSQFKENTDYFFKLIDYLIATNKK